MIPIGPQVAFVDDVQEQIQPLFNAFTRNFNTGAIVFNASPEESKYPETTYDSVRLLFLDLYYNGPFDPEISAQWVLSIIPPNTIYALIIWSRDTDKKEELLEVLEENHIMPTFVESWQKTDFEIATHNFIPQIEELIHKVSGSQESNELVFGQIIDIEDDGILVNCILNREAPTFQVRKFDHELFSTLNVATGNFIKINIATHRGTRIIEIMEEANDLSENFKAKDYFEGLENTPFFTED